MHEALRPPVARIALVLAAVLLMPAAGAAQSTGSPAPGTIPKPAVQPRQKPEVKPQRKPAAKAADWDVAGRWSWKAKCTNGTWRGGWSIVQSSPSRFSGGYTGTNLADVGVIADGRLSGDTMTFVHEFTDIFGVAHASRNRGTLQRSGGGLVMEGTSGDQTFSCSFTATK